MSRTTPLQWLLVGFMLVSFAIGYVSLDQALDTANGYLCVGNCASFDLQLGPLWGSVPEGYRVTSPALIWVARLALLAGISAGIGYRLSARRGDVKDRSPSQP